MSESVSEFDPQVLINRAIADNRLAHALLIHGQNLDQIGKFANELAARIMEMETSDGLEERLANHPDVFALRPSKKSRIITVDNMRELIRNVQHSPQRGLKKVAFLHEVDRLHTSAANAFLKTLEEPPLNTTLFLLTTKPHSLLATIRSRCQLFRLPSRAIRFDDERALSWLDGYESWLSDLLSGGPGGKASVPHFVMGLYGLVERFSGIIEALTKEEWKKQSAQATGDMTDDERIALESRISIFIRQEFLCAIESATECFMRDRVATNPQAANKFVDSVHALENATDLLRLNMKSETMLESFLLRALRIWTAK